MRFSEYYSHSEFVNESAFYDRFHWSHESRLYGCLLSDDELEQEVIDTLRDFPYTDD